MRAWAAAQSTRPLTGPASRRETSTAVPSVTNSWARDDDLGRRGQAGDVDPLRRVAEDLHRHEGGASVARDAEAEPPLVVERQRRLRQEVRLGPPDRES